MKTMSLNFACTLVPGDHDSFATAILSLNDREIDIA